MIKEELVKLYAKMKHTVRFVTCSLFKRRIKQRELKH